MIGQDQCGTLDVYCSTKHEDGFCEPHCIALDVSELNTNPANYTQWEETTTCTLPHHLIFSLQNIKQHDHIFDSSQNKTIRNMSHNAMCLGYDNILTQDQVHK
jgi:hypothetical protein